MRTRKFYLYFSLPVFVLLLLVTGYFVINNKVEYASSTLGDNLAGHAWDTVYGWSSYNSCNTAYTLPPYTVDSNNCWASSDWGWGVTFNTDAGTGEITGGYINGWMWHDNVGWICLGLTCASATAACGSDITPPGGSLGVTFGTPVSSWAELSGWGKVCAWGDVGDASWISLNCANNSSCGTVDYKVYLNVDDYTLGSPSVADSYQGFVWNGYNSGSDTNLGFGFMQFSPDMSVAHVIHFRAENSDIYSSQTINARVGLDSSEYNSMYLILANGGVTNFTTEELNANGAFSDSYIRTDIDYGGILAEDIPGTEDFYYNQLGWLDLGGIINGDYSATAAMSDFPSGTLPANGLVYIRAGDLHVTSPVTAAIGSGSTSGASTIVVQGNAYISSTIMYQSGAVNNLINLPSLTVVVLGDVFIDPSVDKVDGNWFVLGGAANTCPDLFDPSLGCGRFSTGNSSTTPLTVNGMVMSRQFNLERTYTDALNNPAELFRFDGRIIANPPPGFGDFATDLPNYEENLPF